MHSSTLEFFESLEHINSINPWDIQDTLEESGVRIKEWDNILTLERRFLNFGINKGQIISNVQLTDVNGEIIDSLNISDDDITYLTKRINETSNSFLKSKYANIVWQQTKINTFADVAIDNYMESLHRISSENVSDSSIIVSAILYIAKRSRRKINASKEFSLKVLANTPCFLKGRVLTEIVDSKLFKNDELEYITHEALSWYDESDYSSNKNNIDYLVTFFIKLKKPVDELYSLLALNEDIMLSHHPDEDDFVRFTSLGAKAQYLKKAKKYDEHNQVLKEYGRLKQIMKLHKIEVEVDEDVVESLNEYLNCRSEAILGASTEAILSYFAVSDKVIVNADENIESPIKSTSNSLRKLFTVSVFDINNNYKKLSNDNKLEKEIFDNYHISHTTMYYILFLKVFMNGIICGKINYYKVFKFLQDFTWYGQKFDIRMRELDIQSKSSWLSMLSPGIHNFFSQFELSTLLRTHKVNNYILSIDSLTLKFEGALRDFIRLTGGSTTVFKKEIPQEQLLEELLENEKIKELFTDNDIYLFKYAFTRSGLNIRNDVAHSFLQFYDYDLQKISLIFLCLLRLGRYTLINEESEV